MRKRVIGALNLAEHPMGLEIILRTLLDTGNWG